MFRTDDPIADFNRYDAKRERALKKYPKCCWCDEPITDDHFYNVEGNHVHTDCIVDFCDENYRVSTDNYIA